MRYKGIYWTVFAPMIRRSMRERFGRETAEQAVRRGKGEYRRIVEAADELGPGNPLAMNAYFAYVFAGAWLGCGRTVTPEDMGAVMTDVLTTPLVRTVLGCIDLNRSPRYWYRSMKRYEAWCERHGRDYPATWKVGFDEGLHRDGSYYYFTSCPICAQCHKQGIGELMGALCATDRVMFALQHGVLHREHVIAQGGAMCDYWVVGDRVRDAK